MKCCEPAEGTGSAAGLSVNDRIDAPAQSSDQRHVCAQCGEAGRPVTRQTVLLMLKPELLGSAGEGDFLFCAALCCRVVYFSDAGQTFTTAELRVRVGLKEREDPIPLCYCFGFDESHIREEIERDNQTTIPQRVSALVKQRHCACEACNPSGMCCLGEVKKSARRLLAQR